MQAEHASQRQIPDHPEVPFEAHQVVIEERIAAELSEARRAGEDALKAQLISQDHRDRVVQLLGSEPRDTSRVDPSAPRYRA
jgi:hypothetical protein